MKAIIYNKKTSPKLILKEVERPEPKDDQVLVKISFTSVNAADYRSMKMGMIPKSKIFGASIAGTVESVGKNVKKFQPGDQVMGDLADSGFGGFAEYIAAPANMLIHKPDNIPAKVAASIPLAATTALLALQKKGEIQKGQKVLILGSSGGVGTFAVQLAKHFDTTVTGVCSTRNIAQTLALGADHTIDYTQEDFTKGNERYDRIIAINGNYPLLACKRLLNPNGIYVVVGGSMAQLFKTIFLGWLLSIGSKKMRFLSAKANPDDLAVVTDLASQGKIRPVIEKEFSLEDTAEAMSYAAAGHAQGKVVIQVSE